MSAQTTKIVPADRMIGQVLIQDRTVAVGWVKAIVAAAQRGGGDEAKMLTAAGIDSLPNDPLVRIPLDAVVRLWRAAIDSTGDSAFGLRMGQAIEPTSFDVVAYTLVSSNSLREAIIRLQRFQKLISDGGRVQLVERNGLEWMMYQSMEADLPFSPQQVEAALACSVTLMRWVIGASFAPARICMAHAAIAPLSVYRDILGCEPEFRSRFNGIGLPPSQLDALLPARNPELCHLHELMARRQLSALKHSPNIKQRVAAILQQLLTRGMAHKKQVASLIGMSPRTMQHRLAEENSNFVALLDEVRHRLALKYIAEPMLSLSQIAELLHFSDASAFYRAFRRWTGRAPGEYRRTINPQPAIPRTDSEKADDSAPDA